MTPQVLDLSHDLHPGMYTHPGLPAPQWEAYKTRQQYQETSGTTFQIDRICMVGNTGTYLDSPYHRYADGGDLASIPLSQVVNVRVVLVDVRAHRAVRPDALKDALGSEDITGAAVLLHTGGDTHWGTDAYAVESPYMTASAADWLADRRPGLVGIDSVNIDDLDDASRPVHTRLLGEDILILEHLTNLGAVPARNARLHAAPLAWHGVGTWPVRASATVYA
jgi:kynurenine formamidase